MIRRTHGWMSLAVLSAALLPGFAHAQGAGAMPPASASTRAAPAAVSLSSRSLDGIWMFDAAHSDDPRKVMEASRPQGAPEGAGGGGGWGGGGGGGGFGRGGGGGGGGMGRRHRGGEGGSDGPGGSPGQGEGGDAEHQPRINPMQRILRPPQKVVIEMLADEVRVSEDELPPRGYAISDSLKVHGHDLVTEGGVAQWHSGRLEMKQTLGQRGALVETYALSSDGKTLTIKAHREGGRFDMPAITRVYTRYDGE